MSYVIALLGFVTFIFLVRGLLRLEWRVDVIEQRLGIEDNRPRSREAEDIPYEDIGR